MASHGLPISIRGVSKSFGSVTALQDVSLDIHAGEFLTLLGPSGSGKTTLLMVLAGFVRPDRGSVLFGEQAVERMPPHRRNVGMVFQNYALFPHMSVYQNVEFPLRLRGAGSVERRERVERVLDLVGLSGYGDRRIHELSGGQQQRIALARAIVFEPRILLMDEPLSALDKKLRERMQVEIRRLHERLGITTVYVTHDQREALTMSDRIAVANHGRLIQVDTPTGIYERPRDGFVADFIGESYVVPLERRRDGVAFGGRPVRSSHPLPPGERLALVLRPERLVFLDGPGDDLRNRFDGRVIGSIFQGESVLTHVALADGTEVAVRELVRAGGSARRFAPGDAVSIGLHVDDAFIVEAKAEP